ncbi:RDD family protein [Puniceicoccus vermicola]|uniref:RDD family protein n=1 Tax=Puniceicoccus vermicola TaxID=388746 RepID=A0A7X1AX96_9BACT|nr:RDD family protein [Puniceicoccus vermicola]MBC2601666.1 RDD family protein [Puniceicoccus vermicola]
MNQKFLPLKIEGKHVYVGFWMRLAAGLADALILISFGFLFAWLESIDRNLAIAVTIPSATLFAFYNIFFNARFGGTPGKLFFDIRITRPDGTPIGWRHAWWRSSVDLFFAVLFLCVKIWALSQIDPETYTELDWLNRSQELSSFYPAWYGLLGILSAVWVWGEFIVLLLNKRKRAIHDFIAGTIVIKKEFSMHSKDILKPPLGNESAPDPAKPL